MRWLNVGLATLVGLPLLLLAAGQAGLLAGQAPDDLGVRDGRLKAPARTPNSVSSQAALWPGLSMREAATVEPLPLLGGDGPATLARLRSIAADWPGATLVTEQPDYLYVTFRTRWLGFVDDAEFWFDPAQNVVQVRSSSRIGRKDFGVNRARVERLRALLAAV
jgi:uncharacterized protein (DUF1499 family)